MKTIKDPLETVTVDTPKGKSKVFRFAPKINDMGTISGNSLFNRFQIFFVRLALKFRFLMSAGLIICKKITLRGPGGKISVWLQNIYDFKVFREVFIKKEYEISINKEVHTVIDVGSNIGYSIAFFFLQYPLAQIYALEPIEESFQRLKEVCVQNKRLHPIKIALSKTDGVVKMYKGKSLASSSFIQRTETGTIEEVEGCTFSRFLKKEKLGNVDLLKVDAEGAEEFILKDSSIKNVSVIVGEIHEDLIGTEATDVVRFLKESGFSIELKRETSKRALLYARR